MNIKNYTIVKSDKFISTRKFEVIKKMDFKIDHEKRIMDIYVETDLFPESWRIIRISHRYEGLLNFEMINKSSCGQFSINCRNMDEINQEIISSPYTGLELSEETKDVLESWFVIGKLG